MFGWIAGWKQGRGYENHNERGSNDGIGGAETNPTGELLKQARDGTSGAGS